MMRSLLFLVPFHLLHHGDDPSRQGLIISELLLLFLASPLEVLRSLNFCLMHLLIFLLETKIAVCLVYLHEMWQ